MPNARAPIMHEGATFAIGDRVRIEPKRCADAFDIVLRGRAATVCGMEHDVDGRTFATVTIDDDPGADLGLTGQPGHRFFFELDELMLIEKGGAK
jgi:hypothetical protein